MMIDHARGYLGTRFQHQARVPGSGLDCVGVVVLAAKADGVQVEDFFAYGPEADPKELLPRIATFCDRVEVAARQPDDLLVFWLVEPDRPQHLGIYEGSGFMIHAYARRSKDGSVRRDCLYRTDQMAGLVWERHLHSAWRVKPEKRTV